MSTPQRRGRTAIEIDSGLRRTGVAPRAAAEVGRAAADAGLRVAGVFTFPGHGYGHAPRPASAPHATRSERWARRSTVISSP
ncbi:alanine racemase [Streptomyces sp. NPDC053069]|uniref:alanine racemase n=1 Tax=Streptomyces sp. NPDC053069 TaxID=3365695 RepID=UPI0037D0FB15